MAAVRVEDVKAAGIAVDIDALAERGWEAISEEDRYRLKTQGVCTQRQVGVFMLRIRVAGGKATPLQLRTAAALAERYAHPSLHITTRGGLEIHHAKIGDVPAIQSALEAVGLTTKGTCGDTIRNVIACAHAGTYAGEVLPPAPYALALHDHIVRISDATNISRKMNVAFACSPHCDEHVATSDIGFVATPALPGTGGLPTFTLWGAGGLGAAPRLAIELRRGIAQTQLLAAFDAVVSLGKKYGDRSARAKAKIKMLVDAWGADRVRAVFDEEFALTLAASGGIAEPSGLAALAARAGDVAASVRDIFAGDATASTLASRNSLSSTASRARPPVAGRALAQKQPGLFTIPALVPMGELPVASARALAEAAERYGDGIVHLTPDQNAELHDVAEADVAAAVAAIEGTGLRTEGRGGISDVVSCVGLEYCPLAVAHSMTMGEELAIALAPRRADPRFADFRIHVSGCPHSCAKHQVADVGLAGAMTDVDGKKVEAFQLFLAGNARARTLGKIYPKKIPRTAVLPVVEALLETYERTAVAGERFSETVARTGSDPFFETIAATMAGGLHPLPAVRGGHLVVIGNGMAGARFVENLRDRASEGFEVTVLGEEPHGGYNRIMLSGVLAGFREASEIVTHPPEWFEERRVSLHRGTRAVAIDRTRRTVTCEDGAIVSYDALVIATGSTPVVPPMPGLAGAHIFVMRTIEDCARIRDSVRAGTKAVVLGGGLLGLEAASGLRALGADVTVAHLAPTLMEQQLDATGGHALRTRIEALAITVRTGAKTLGAYDDADGRGIELEGGERIAADLIVVCCGIRANVALARAAGLDVGRGILVDDGLQTSDPHVFALGECVEHRGVTYGLVEPLWEQCEVLASRLTGKRVSYAGSRVGTKLKVAGVNVVALGAREPATGDESIAVVDASGSYRRGIVRGGHLIGAQVVGDAAAAATLGKAFERGTALPGSLAALLFGADGAHAPRVAVAPGERRVCICNEISQAEIAAAIAGGASDVAEIGRLTLAGTGCGTCRGELAAMVIGAKNGADPAIPS